MTTANIATVTAIHERYEDLSPSDRRAARLIRAEIARSGSSNLPDTARALFAKGGPLGDPPLVGSQRVRLMNLAIYGENPPRDTTKHINFQDEIPPRAVPLGDPWAILHWIMIEKLPQSLELLFVDTLEHILPGSAEKMMGDHMTFEALISRLDDLAIYTLMRDTSTPELALALKYSSDLTRTYIISKLNQRERKVLETEMDAVQYMTRQSGIIAQERLARRCEQLALYGDILMPSAPPAR